MRGVPSAAVDCRLRRIDTCIGGSQSEQHPGTRASSCPDQLILSREVEDEYREVLLRPKFDRFVTVDKRQLILDIVASAALRIEPNEAVRECRDPKDDKYLSLAACGGANVIVSSDARHLLSMHPWRGVLILSPTTFLALP